MKKSVKYFFTFIFLFFIFIVNISAADIKSIACEYDIKNYLDGGNSNYGKLQVIISNYNNGESSDYNSTIFYKNDADEWVPYESGGINDFKNNSAGLIMNIMNNKNKNYIKSFADNYKSTGKCPRMYTNYNGGLQLLEVTNEVTQPNANISYSASSTFLKGPNDTSWVNEKSFYDREKNNQGNSIQNSLKELNCSYSMKFDSLPDTSSVIFKRSINKNNNQYTYSVSIDGIEQTTTSLNNDIMLQLGQFTNGSVNISGETLNKVLGGDECADKNEIFHYLSGQNADQGNYSITTNIQEVKNDAIGGRAGTGDGEEVSGNFEEKINTPKIDFVVDFSDEEMNCEELMGDNLMKVLKAAFVLLRVGAAIIVIIKASIALIPAVQKGDDGEIKKATKKCVSLAIILVVIGLLPTLVNVIAKICGFENSCVVALL